MKVGLSMKLFGAIAISAVLGFIPGQGAVDVGDNVLTEEYVYEGTDNPVIDNCTDYGIDALESDEHYMECLTLYWDEDRMALLDDEFGPIDQSVDSIGDSARSFRQNDLNDTSGGISDDAIQECIDDGMSLSDIQEHQGECIAHFWTDERRQVADGNTLGREDVSADAFGMSNGVDITNDGSYFNALSKPSGKMYAYNTVKNEFGTCSASVVDSASQRLIITAAHCIHTGLIDDGPPGSEDGYFYENVTFIPNYNPFVYDLPEYGEYIADEFYLSVGWRNATPLSDSAIINDIAFGIVDNVKAEETEPIGSVVEGHTMELYGDDSFDARVIGYPTIIENGLRPVGCDRHVHSHMVGIDRFLEVIDCPFAHGASGGPWLVDTDYLGRGIIKSVTSQLDLAVPSLKGPYFDIQAEWAFHNAEYLALGY